ncbi:hypothetical protein GBAR_LOCUS22610 [Geodia barretti]|uniref:Uncharacterized protein n=1 Tax=Geodia barretti TaxID=519541 RepID=A0AA35X7K4_GEOBA|nr:hypothetical protein GBAR_LOCUS22610 [Geodia barretti]
MVVPTSTMLPSASPVETVTSMTSSAVMETISIAPMETPTTPPTAQPPITTDPTSEPILGTGPIIAIAAGGGILLAIIVILSIICCCYCVRKSRRSATYDITRGRPVYVVRRWDEGTDHVPNRGGSFSEKKGSSISSSISSIASIILGSLKRNRNNSQSHSGADIIANLQVLKVTPV